jgi:HPt (histidine-containing phosphotransfer) domain-containing protein
MAARDCTGSTPESTADLIDASVIQGLRELGGEEDPGLLVELIDLYLADAPQRMSEIRQALSTCDWKLLERAAHTLKSSSANIGALELSSICKELEAKARACDEQVCAALCERSGQQLVRVESALRGIRA